jgi:hypothetical protein
VIRLLWNVTAGNIFADPIEKARDAKAAKAALLGAPLSFEANQRQTDSVVGSLPPRRRLLVISDIARSCLHPAAVRWPYGPPSIVRVELRGANRGAQLTGADELTGIANYHVGNDPKWRSGITTYGKVKY